ncbi:hypothetical protein SAMN02910297_01224 [Methanobrevibacter olleyae]|uniref:Uncharacterized protein n=1 Tax=Methanobrevibacter olleyae TaxID=294671 RepID=A0A1I4IRJ8_METOL|nr:hypothetical protein [Methanobrevibacter olleyae]SFL56623.1 hypothetical protein SAMN02910297_01224 [Methanobrevibacter olleyae]
MFGSYLVGRELNMFGSHLVGRELNMFGSHLVERGFITLQLIEGGI